MGEHQPTRTPVTYDSCAHIEGPFYHGTKSRLAPPESGSGFARTPSSSCAAVGPDDQDGDAGWCGQWTSRP